MKRLERLREEKWEAYMDANPPKGAARFYYKDNAEYWMDGFDACAATLLPEVQKLVGALKKYKSTGAYDLESDAFNDWAAEKALADWQKWSEK